MSTADYMQGPANNKPRFSTVPCADHVDYRAANCPVCTHEIRTRHRSPQQRGQRIRTITPPPADLIDKLKGKKQ